MKLLQSNGIRFCVRENTSDEKAFREVIEKRCYERREFQVEAGERWFDLGANVGAFACYALSKGVSSVVCYEPDPENCMQAVLNLKANGFDAPVIQSAVTHRPNGMVTLNLWPKGQSWRNSVVRKVRGCTEIKVPTVNVFSILKNGDCCKMDIEGSEIEILEAWPENLRLKKMVVEYSFDVDPSAQRLVRIGQKMKKSFAHVHYRRDLERMDKWTFFPAATLLYCWN